MVGAEALKGEYLKLEDGISFWPFWERKFQHVHTEEFYTRRVWYFKAALVHQKQALSILKR